MCAGTDAVLIDPVVGINAAVGHLCALGHERIAFIGGDPALYDRPRVHGTSMDEDRLDAFRAAVRMYMVPAKMTRSSAWGFTSRPRAMIPPKPGAK